MSKKINFTFQKITKSGTPSDPIELKSIDDSMIVKELKELLKNDYKVTLDKGGLYLIKKSGKKKYINSSQTLAEAKITAGCTIFNSAKEIPYVNILTSYSDYTPFIANPSWAIKKLIEKMKKCEEKSILIGRRVDRKEAAKAVKSCANEYKNPAIVLSGGGDRYKVKYFRSDSKVSTILDLKGNNASGGFRLVPSKLKIDLSYPKNGKNEHKFITDLFVYSEAKELIEKVNNIVKNEIDISPDDKIIFRHSDGYDQALEKDFCLGVNGLNNDYASRGVYTIYYEPANSILPERDKAQKINLDIIYNGEKANIPFSLDATLYTVLRKTEKHLGFEELAGILFEDWGGPESFVKFDVIINGKKKDILKKSNLMKKTLGYLELKDGDKIEAEIEYDDDK